VGEDARGFLRTSLFGGLLLPLLLGEAEAVEAWEIEACLQTLVIITIYGHMCYN